MNRSGAFFVTGASSGLGARTAELLAAQGYRVAGAARRVERIAELSGVMAVHLDLTDPASVVTLGPVRTRTGVRGRPGKRAHLGARADLRALATLRPSARARKASSGSGGAVRPRHAESRQSGRS
jgi:NAD(P)-dependent dehydrogenase (short-subunit alcohol dehydrogenase family)